MVPTGRRDHHKIVWLSVGIARQQDEDDPRGIQVGLSQNPVKADTGLVRRWQTEPSQARLPVMQDGPEGQGRKTFQGTAWGQVLLAQGA